MKLNRLLAAPLLIAAVACGSAAVAPASHTVDLGEKDAGTTIQVRAGDTLRVQLVETFPVPGSSLVWDVTSTDPAVLAVTKTGRTGPPQAGPGPGRTDTYTASFNAVAAGQSTLDAHGATTCEAMMKQACPDRNFTITVVVSG
jgi:predicted secreted protein